MKLHDLLRLACTFIVLALTGACGTQAQVQIATPAPVYLQVAGSTAMQPALLELAAAYRERHPEVTIDVQGGNSQAGVQFLLKGEVDLAAVSWRDPEEADGGSAREPYPVPLKWTPIGRDGMAIIVHPHNTWEEAGLLLIREVFAGWHATWDELGGTGGEIEIVSREDGSGSRAAFEAMAMRGQSVSNGAVVMPSSQAVVDWVASHPGAVGYVSRAYVTEAVKVVTVEGVSLNAHSIEAGQYPLTHKLYLVTRTDPDESVEELLRFCLSPVGQTIVRRYHGRP